jgi:hypothetical protein
MSGRTLLGAWRSNGGGELIRQRLVDVRVRLLNLALIDETVLMSGWALCWGVAE